MIEGFARGLRWNLLSLPLHTALALANSVLLARVLGIREFGNYAILTSFYATLGLLTDLGLSSVLGKMGAELAAHGRRVFAAFLLKLLVLRLAVFAAGVALSWLLAPRLAGLFHLDHSAPGLFLAFAFIVGLESAAGFAESALTSLFEIRNVHLSQLLQKAVVALGLGSASLLRWGLAEVAVVMALAHGLQAVLSGLWLGRAVAGMAAAAPRDPRPLDRGRISRLALANYWTKLSNLASSPQFMTLLLAFFLPPAAAGLFSFTCEFTLRFITGGLQPISNLLLPSFSASFLGGTEGGHKRVFASAAAILSVVTIPSVALAMALTQPLIWLLYPPGFWPSARLVLVLLPLLGLAHFLLFLLGTLAIGYERYRHWIYSKLLTMLLLALVVVLSPRLGVSAATVGYGAALALVNLRLYRSLKAEFGLELPWSAIGKLAASAAVYTALALAGVSLLGSERPAAGLALALLLGFAFPATLRAAGGLSREDKDVLRGTGVPELALRWL